MVYKSLNHAIYSAALLFHFLRKGFEKPGLHPVVGIHERYVFSMRFFNATITCSRHSCVGLMDNLNANINFPAQGFIFVFVFVNVAILLTNLPATIRTPVIHEDEFEVTEGLCQQAVNAAPQVRCYVINRHNDGNQNPRFVKCHVAPIMTLVMPSRGWP